MRPQRPDSRKQPEAQQMSGGIGYLALKTGLWAKSGRLYRDILSDARSPDAASEALLRRILAQNAETSFGQAHGFARIQTAEQYRQAVPVQTYESLRELIERQELTGERCLTAEQPVSTTAPAVPQRRPRTFRSPTRPWPASEIFSG